MRGFLGTNSQEPNLKKHGFLLPALTPASAVKTLMNFFSFLSQFEKNNCSGLFWGDDTNFKKLVPHFNAKLWCFIAASSAVLNGLL